MRLLNTRTLRPAEFYGDVPNYAILSHTWGTEEIMLQDLQDGYRASRKNGYNKISNCCEQAGRDGYDWIWIDSCCKR
jgi:hypothetical protein